MKKVPKDQFGNEIKIGSVITYPSRHGSCLWMSIAVISNIKIEKTWNNYEEFLFETYSIEGGTFFATDIKEKKLKKNTKFSSYERSTVIPSDYIKEKYPQIYEKALELLKEN